MLTFSASSCPRTRSRKLVNHQASIMEFENDRSVSARVRCAARPERCGAARARRKRTCENYPFNLSAAARTDASSDTGSAPRFEG